MGNNKTEKKKSVEKLAREHLEVHYNEKNKSILFFSKATLKGKAGNFFVVFCHEGLFIYEFNEKKEEKLVELESHLWSEWETVTIDHFAVKSVFIFNGSSSWTLITEAKGKEAEGFIRVNTNIKVELVNRKWHQKILGFRSNKKWKKITASIVYTFALLLFLSMFIDNEADTIAEKSEPVVANQKTDSEPNNDTEQDKNDEPESDNLEFTGDMSVTTSAGKIKVELTSNVPDGGIFEVSIINGFFDVASEFLEIKDGKIVHTFNVEEWNPSYGQGDRYVVQNSIRLTYLNLKKSSFEVFSDFYLVPSPYF